MKLLKLRLMNLNSMAGEWAIDFNAPEYVSDGIFAITGPTGAGKSTLLDAVCLALYGRTPRLKVISRTTNEIMSRQTGECFAEAVFRTKQGCYKSHWSQRRARKKPDGNLMDTRHEICDAATGRILASKKREVAAWVEKVTGMDFDRFTRSMMLAQGGFAAFLAAAADQRAPILEKMTGTAVYGDISKHVHERQRNVHDSLNHIEAQIGHIVLLPDEVQKEIKIRLGEKQRREKVCRQQADALTGRIQWQAGIDALVRDLDRIHREKETVDRAMQAFEPDRKRLEQGLKAARLDSVFARLDQLRRQQDRDEKRLSNARLNLPDREKDLGKKERVFKDGLKNFEDAKRRFKLERDLIRTVREKDLKLKQSDEALTRAGRERRRIETQRLHQKKEREKIGRKQDTLNSRLAEILSFLITRGEDEQLAVVLAGLREKLASLGQARLRQSEKRNQVTAAQKDLDTKKDEKKEATGAFARAKQRLEDIEETVSRAGADFEKILAGRLLREYRAEYDHLVKEMIYLNKIAGLKAHRAELEDGRPCPLCGATEHPFSKGGTPAVSDVRQKADAVSGVIKSAEKIEYQLKESREKERAASQVYIRAEKQMERATQAVAVSNKVCEGLEAESGRIAADVERITAAVLSALAGHGFKTDAADDFNRVVHQLEIRLDTFRCRQEEKKKLERQVNACDADIKSLDALILSLEDNLTRQDKIINELGRAHQQLKHEREAVYGRKDPDIQEAEFEAVLLACESALETARRRLDQSKAGLVAARHDMHTLENAVKDRQKDLGRCESDFLEQIHALLFKDEQSFLSCRLPLKEREALARQAKELDDRHKDVEAIKKDRERKLAEARAENKTSLTPEVLNEQLSAVREEMKRLGEETGALKQQLADDKLAKVRLKEKIKILEDQKEECRRWDALHALIGSADGKKYRNFAQGLTFDLVISHANQQLAGISDRYLLVRDDKKTLELNIMDNYQAGEIRSTKNLSGGESFLVSLCLALGLSKMASRNIRVDSLFLDEGFGTLDEAALETALEALAGLQQEGKLIGIISHVSAIKERIAARISVSPVSGGNSMMKGPGCSRLT